ncbi:hypothetical protein SDC9_107950 [bioreactor metagenome]|uniref:Uncharacterized protein n=1 Tax=bioreactor metagenome TaxID=1076179 RepID=A0A645B7Q7_9ZZZZ
MRRFEFFAAEQQRDGLVVGAFAEELADHVVWRGGQSFLVPVRNSAGGTAQQQHDPSGQQSDGADESIEQNHVFAAFAAQDGKSGAGAEQRQDGD